MKIAVINGANINFTGIRQLDVYGSQTLDKINTKIVTETENIAKLSSIRLDLHFFQSNIEGDIINFLQQCHHKKFDGIVLNPGAFTHYSYAIRDAVASISIPVIEVHMSNPHAREDFRHKSVIAPICRGQICGLGYNSYSLAIHALIKINLEVK